MKNYYKTLGIRQSASPEEIKKAYIQLAIKYHPDKNPGDDLSEQFKEINEAKQVLLNDLKKFNYDSLLVDFLAKNNRSKFSDARRKRTKTIYAKTRIALRKNRLFLAILFSVTILVCAAFFQMPADESVIDSPGIQQSTLRLEKPLEAKAVVLSSFETNKKAAEQTRVTNEVATKRPIASIKKARKKNKIAAPVTVRTAAPKKRKVLPVKLSNREMATILNNIRAEKQKLGSNSNCVQIFKTNKSNIQNGFALADFLKSYGFVITGREKILSNSSGINISARGNCIKVTLGSL